MSATVDPIVALSQEILDKGSKSFAMAARLLPRDVRNDAMMLYAWCRHCDDEIDDQHLGFASGEKRAFTPSERLEMLKQKTQEALEGKASEPVFIALGRVAEKHHIPARHPFELLHGFEMDVQDRNYRTLDDTLDYCYHVAGVVGVMMAMIMGVRETATLNRASDLGLAFQLTNIARDVIDDAKLGRVYLPLDWLEQKGVPAAEIAEEKHRKAVFDVTQRLVKEADVYYRSALHGMRDLPFGAALGIGAARRVYRDIGRIVVARGEAAFEKRAVVAKPRKAAAALSGVVAAMRAHTVLRLVNPPSRKGLWTMPGLGQSLPA